MSETHATHRRPRLLERALGACALLAALGGARAAAQTAPLAFRPGELYLHSASINIGSAVVPGLVRIDPHSGATTLVLRYLGLTEADGGAVYDPFRDRMLVSAQTSLGKGIWKVAANGVFEPLLPGVGSARALAVGAAGRLYAWIPGPSLVHVSATDVGTKVINVAGNGFAVSMPGAPLSVDCMIWEPKTNALFFASRGGPGSCGDALRISVRKLPLTPAGNQAAVGFGCAQFDVDPVSADEVPVGWSHGPGGSLLLGVDTNSNAQQQRVLRVDPQTLAISSYAAPGPYVGAAASSAISYSPSSGRAYVLDSLGNGLRTYAAGQSGSGAWIPTPMCSGPTTSGELARLCPVVAPAAASGLSVDTSALPVESGGVQHFDLELGAQAAGDVYVVLGSLSDWYPLFPVDGLAVPLVWDEYTSFTLTSGNTLPLFGSLGVLDGQGKADARLDLPPALDAGIVGGTVYHAAIALDLGQLAVVASSNAVHAVFTP